MLNSNNKNSASGHIRISRKMNPSTSSKAMYYAYLYVAGEPDRGTVNSRVLDAFELMYSALGLHKHGSQEEATRIGMRSISILQGHIDYMTTVLNLKTDNISSSVLPTIKNDDLSKIDSEKIEMSEEDDEAVDIFASFNID